MSRKPSTSQVPPTSHEPSMSQEPPMSGPLLGVRVLELTAIGPVPFCGALLADMGADVVRLFLAGSANSNPLCRSMA